MSANAGGLDTFSRSHKHMKLFLSYGRFVVDDNGNRNWVDEPNPNITPTLQLRNTVTGAKMKLTWYDALSMLELFKQSGLEKELKDRV